MKFLSFCALALVLLSVESVLVKSLGLEVTRIDVTVALVVYAGLRGTTVEGAFTAFGVGYLLDVFSGRPAGLYPFLAVLLFLGCRALGQLVDGRSRGMFAAIVAGATLVQGLLALFFTWLTSSSGGAERVLSLRGLPLQLLLTAALAALLFPLLRRIEPGERHETGVQW